MPKTPRVFFVEVPNKAGVIDEASSFGETVVLFTKQDRRPSCFATTEFMDALRAKLRYFVFDPAVDYVCVAGSLLPVVLLAQAAKDLSERASLRLLAYHASDCEYVECTLE